VKTWPAAVIFDFDGVILESNDLKDLGFQNLFADFPEHHGALQRFHLANETLGRVAKVRSLLREVLPPDVTAGLDLDALEAQWLKRYQEDTRREYLRCPEVKGALALLEWLHREIPLFVASATLDEEVNWVVESRGLKKFFAKVYGGPKVKADLIREILATNGFSPRDVVLIGDSDKDVAVSHAMGVGFIGRRVMSRFADASFPVFDDLDGVGSFLKSLKGAVK
jgi:phosphoglycolate phosphatase-like HAD superfamily hydrolase